METNTEIAIKIIIFFLVLIILIIEIARKNKSTQVIIEVITKIIVLILLIIIIVHEIKNKNGTKKEETQILTPANEKGDPDSPCFYYEYYDENGNFVKSGCVRNKCKPPAKCERIQGRKACRCVAGG